VDEPPVVPFDLAALEAARAELQDRTGELYLEFLRRDSMSCGLYVLEPGADDPHRFADVTERLSVLVFFAPAESA
jgi:hypothetical protein